MILSLNNDNIYLLIATLSTVVFFFMIDFLNSDHYMVLTEPSQVEIFIKTYLEENDLNTIKMKNVKINDQYYSTDSKIDIVIEKIITDGTTKSIYFKWKGRYLETDIVYHLNDLISLHIRHSTIEIIN